MKNILLPKMMTCILHTKIFYTCNIIERLKKNSASSLFLSWYHNSCCVCFVYPYNYFLQKTWCLGRIIPPLLQSTVVFLLRKTWLNITSEMFSCLCQNAIISKCFIVNKIKGYDLLISHIKICLNYVSIH